VQFSKVCSLKVLPARISLLSRRQSNAQGGAISGTLGGGNYDRKPAKRATEIECLSPVSRAWICFVGSTQGCSPWALFLRPLRGLENVSQTFADQEICRKLMSQSRGISKQCANSVCFDLHLQLFRTPLALSRRQ
jgi:hypothetical protein